MRIITTTPELEELAQSLAGASYLALDTEFMRDQTYWPKLCLIQVATTDEQAIIDPLGDIDLSPFHEVLRSPKTVKVLHAARQDIEIFFHQAGVIPHPLFDTQIAAMVCGFGDAASYETLARRLAHVEIDKSARFTDWSRRPLSPRQLEYALADVTHLRTIYAALSARLRETGRAAWVAEEIAALQDPDLYRLDPENAWKRLRPRTTSKRFLSMLAALAAWREREAQARDVPRARILKDEAISEIAAHPPESAEGLERIRAVPKGFASSRLGRGVMDAIQEGRHRVPPEVAPVERPRRKKEPVPSTVDLLKALLRLRADEAGVAHRLIADAEDIERLAVGEDEGVSALHGWRAEVFGKDAIALRRGELALALENGRAIVVELEDQP
ncbi:MAG: ribonuclease D [Alphaproteobacteria bacterium]|nr:ribonuclease D [Alphaproteobacteria bacterium]